MHDSCRAWMSETVTTYGLAERSTLEVGSRYVNGQIRDLFSGSYVGVDMENGVNVDHLADAAALPFGANTFQTVVSTEMLEHVERPWLAVNEMARVLDCDGTLILTARGYDKRGCWEVHGHPFDYWRFSDGAMRLLVEDTGLAVLELTVDPEGPGWFLIAVKP